MDTLAAILAGIAIAWALLLIGQNKKVFSIIDPMLALSSVAILSVMLAVFAYRAAMVLLSGLVP